jgi:hypothetical protein
MNANVVTAKRTDAPFGFDRVPDCRGFGIPRQFEQSCTHIQAARRRGRLARLLGPRQLLTISLISLGFLN